MSVVIRIAAAVIEDAAGRLLLVRKAGTSRFMQPGGKIERGETGADALCRELAEEIGGTVAAAALEPLGRIVAPAANEADAVVDCDLFRAVLTHRAAAAAEIEELVWVTPEEAARLPLAPLTRDHVLPMIAADRQSGRGIRNSASSPISK